LNKTNPAKRRSEPWYSGMSSSSCATSGIHYITLKVAKGEDGIMTTTQVTYTLLSTTFYNG